MAKQHFVLDWGLHALLKFTTQYKCRDVLDIGSGDGQHKGFMECFNKKVYSVDMVKTADFCGDFLEIEFDRQFDAIWCSHVLEHQRNIGKFLDKTFALLKPGGVLAIVVPTHDRDVMIAGHLSSWSIPLLVYNLVMAGYDCSKAAILNTYELSLIVEKKSADHVDRDANSIFGRVFDESEKTGGGDLNFFAYIEKFFPFPISQGAKISGIGGINWGDITQYQYKATHSLPSFESKNLHNQPALVPTLKRIN